MIKGIANRRRIARLKWLRRAGLAVLARLGQRDITIAHHWSPGRRICLHQFRHKGYWFYGRAREQKTMRAFASLIAKGDTVIELGAHIGYISVFLADLVGEEGLVYVFEPSPDNLTYTRRNVAGIKSITLIEQAVSDEPGIVTFFVEGLTGQNSTLIDNYSVFEDNRKFAFSHESYRAIEVSATTIDLFVTSMKIRPDFIKIDVEGAELLCLRGGAECLKNFRPKLMVEITYQHERVFNFLISLGYRAFNVELEEIYSLSSSEERNLFFIDSGEDIDLGNVREAKSG